MFSSIYLYPVPDEHMDRFLGIQALALKIYREYGAIDDATYRSVDISAKYGCLGFDTTIELRANESLCASVSFFRSRAHHDEVMARIDQDPRISDLYRQVQSVVDIGRIRRGEFERVV